MTDRPAAVDLFAGCGGLSEGIRRAGFRVVAGVEKDTAAAKTYAANHPDAVVLNKDIREVSGDDVRRAARVRRVALVAGCAPCQGFCSLTAKYARDDPRNLLLLEMARLIEELRPEAVVMENVPGLLARGEPIISEFRERLGRIGYYAHHFVVQMADFGVPQSRRRFVLLAGRGFMIPLPEPTHARDPKPGDGLQRWHTVRETLHGRKAPPTLREAQEIGGPRAVNWDVVRDLQPQTRARLDAAIPGKSWLAVDEAVRPKCHRGDYVGFTNVYGRMSWDEPSPTITAGCVTPAKGRFGHPDRRRTTISVREAALLQSFPEDYVFATDYIEKACGMIGNAVPPQFGDMLARVALKTIRRHRAALDRQEHVAGRRARWRDG